jgi:tetratricopeptide (TPR) repeat protein
MDLEQRLKQLSGFHDWHAVAEALEQGIGGAADATSKAQLHLRLGRVLRGRFLAGVRALKHFQDAYKLNPALIEALSEARGIYWDLGKLNMVQKLLELELKAAPEAPERSALFRELGDVLCDVGDYERAAESYAKALQSSNGSPSDIPQLLEDVQVGEAEWQERALAILDLAALAATPAEKASLLLRASRLARRFAPEEVEAILAQAYAADPSDRRVAATYEGLLVEGGRTEAILETQRGALDQLEDPEVKARAAYLFGSRWALRHQNVELGAQLVEEALRLDPSIEEAFTFLRDVHGVRGSDWERLIALADELGDRSALGERGAHLLAQAGLIAWKERGDLIRAKKLFERLAQVSNAHPALRAFEAQIGQSLSSPPVEARGSGAAALEKVETPQG